MMRPFVAAAKTHAASWLQVVGLGLLAAAAGMMFGAAGAVIAAGLALLVVGVALERGE